MHPTSAAGLGVLRTALRLIDALPDRLSGRLFAPPADRFTLPDVPQPEAAGTSTGR